MKKQQPRLPYMLSLGGLLVTGLMIATQTPGAEQLEDVSNQVGPISILVDETRAEWNGISAYLGDDDDAVQNSGDIDWDSIAIAHDCDDLYVRYRLHEGRPFAGEAWRYNLFIDADQDAATGYRRVDGALAIGADILIQGGPDVVKTFRFNGASQVAWSWQQVHEYPVDDQLLADGSRDIEFRMRLADLYIDGRRPVGFDWVAVADDPSADVYPDGGTAHGAFNTYTLSYQPVGPGFANPERGLYESTETQANQSRPLNADTLRCYREIEGRTLVHRYYYLENFTSALISQEYLDKMEDDLDVVREAGLKLILRFAYTAASLTPPYGDASKEQILEHINQLSSILYANSDVIAAVQAGFIGLWGEWWYSDYFEPDGDWADRGDVVSALLDAVPSTRMIQLRTPRYKQNIFGQASPLEEGDAHGGSDIARTGHHNDCFVSSPTDGGTYVDPATEYVYLEEDTKWVPMGGETCDYRLLGDLAVGPASCQRVLADLSRFHWSFLNLDWFTPTLRVWLADGCLSDIEERLGYRFSVSDVAATASTSANGLFRFGFTITNDGFAAPYNPRDVELVLRRGDGAEFRAELEADPRFWLPGKPHRVSGAITLPTDVAAGDYALLLNLPDPETSLHFRPEYSIRLANQDVWEPDTGLNDLHLTVAVGNSGSEDPEPVPPTCDTDEATVYVNANGVVVGGPDDGLLYRYDVTELRGTSGSDVIIGTDGPDIIRAYAGRDSICGRGGDDTLYGDRGSDNLFGDEGRDALYGGAGPDQLEGNAGDDALYGEAGDDELFGGAGVDVANGGGGWDVCTGSETEKSCEE